MINCFIGQCSQKPIEVLFATSFSQYESVKLTEYAYVRTVEIARFMYHPVNIHSTSYPRIKCSGTNAS